METKKILVVINANKFSERRIRIILTLLEYIKDIKREGIIGLITTPELELFVNNTVDFVFVINTKKGVFFLLKCFILIRKVKADILVVFFTKPRGLILKMKLLNLLKKISLLKVERLDFYFVTHTELYK